MSMGTEDAASTAVSKAADLPNRKVTINQLIGYNMAWYRQRAGLTQEQLGKRLGGWTKVAVSAAERSWEGKRIRQFSGDEILAIATALDVPAVALLIPPPDAGTTVDYIFATGSTPEIPMDTPALVRHLLPAGSEAESPGLKAFGERVMALGASKLLYPSAEEALQQAIEALGQARREADEILGKTRRHAEGITGEARARAESLERDAQERHKQAMGTLVQQREELERRVDDLRAFEREYRSRLIAQLEGQLSDLRAGVADSDTFPALTS